MAFTPYPKTYRCYHKENGELHRTDATFYRSINGAIKAVKESLMKNSLPYKESVLVSIK